MRLLSFILVLTLCACAREQKVVAAPSVSALAGQIYDGKAVIRQAKGAANIIGDRLNAARTKAERIDYKAQIILENWQ